MSRTPDRIPATDLARAVADAISDKISGATYGAVIDALVNRERRRLRFIGDEEVTRLTGLDDRQRRRLETKGAFPARVPLSDRTDRYEESEIVAWMEQRLDDRDDALRKRTSPNPLAKSNRQATAKASRRNKTAKDAGCATIGTEQ